MTVSERFHDAIQETLGILKKHEFTYQQSIEFLELLRQALIITYEIDAERQER